MTYLFPGQPGGPARLLPDDDIYKRDRSYLGPAPYTFPFRLPYRAIPVGAVVFLVALAVCRVAGMTGLAPYAAALLIACGVAAAAVRCTSPEVPVSALLVIMAHEIGGRRPPRRAPQPETRVLRPGQVRIVPSGRRGGGGEKR